MSTVSNLLTVDEYERMVTKGILPETNRFELIDGRIVEKEVKSPEHRLTEHTRRTIDRLLPAGWHASQEGPVRIPNRASEPEPDVSVVRGEIKDYLHRHPEPADVALVVEITRTTVAKDRAWPVSTAPAASRSTGSSTSPGVRSRFTPPRDRAATRPPKSTASIRPCRWSSPARPSPRSPSPSCSRPPSDLTEAQRSTGFIPSLFPFAFSGHRRPFLP